MLSLLLSACVAAPTVSSERQAIIGGDSDDDDRGVVLLDGKLGDENQVCTASVLSPHVLVTAAHCVSPEIIGPGYVYRVFLGTNLRDAAQRTDQNFVDVSDTHIHPDFDASRWIQGSDIAVVVTAQAMSLPTLALNHTPITADMKGMPVRLVGFGMAHAGDLTTVGQRRTAMSELVGYNDLFIGHGGGSTNTCEGDSGGPILLELNGHEVIAGVVSFGEGGCNGQSNDTRVDVFTSFVDPLIAANDPPDLAPAPDAGVAAGGDASGCNYLAAPAREQRLGFGSLVLFGIALVGRFRRQE
jgi:secreted trypsin-like serine protease